MKRKILLLLAIAFLCQLAEARQPRRGYRGFIEWNNSLRRDTWFKWTTPESSGSITDDLFYFGLSTSHGYQINPMYFAGAGLDLEYCAYDGSFIAALFLQGRIDMKFGKFTPYGDVRIGANFSSGVGAYFSPTVGYRFNWGRKMGVNVGLGLTLAGYQMDCYEATIKVPDFFEISYLGTKHKVKPYFSFRVGIDF